MVCVFNDQTSEIKKQKLNHIQDKSSKINPYALFPF